jgi:hypothetical protein
MTFLELCAAAGLDSGLISSQNTIVAVAGQSGRKLKVVNFVVQAWKAIQNGRIDWAWMRASYNQALTIGQTSYTPAQLGIATRFRFFLPDAAGFQPHTLYDPAIGVSDEQPLCQITPEAWYTIYDRGAQTGTRPMHYALDAGKLLLGPKPDKAYMLRGRYMKSAQVLALDGDVPECPDHLHEVIKWRAIMMLHGQDAAFADRSVAQAEYSRMYRLLCNEQTAPVQMSDSLA